jgi:hypothetical protein
MKKIRLIILIILCACSSKSNLDELLTNNNWQIEKVANLKTGIISQIEKTQEKEWSFKLDKTYDYKNQNQNISGEWKLNGFNLLIINKFDSTKLLIEKITNDEMIWLIEGKDSIRFYLSSKEKKVVVPEFPSIQKSMDQRNQ